ncbi:methyltransferase domain-containing protein [Rubinisphaera italica]|uniref:Arsenite methyltransferase n=1 Tax=Rubinisphaera italica TaxID=2527969 RepID=A0A5C5XPN9_9PLAN|nr:methyltransferase domain-containing protein [Rubinisphaera italica]TWT64035.1 arsenite S-adenosylmethyltransferase [Rubinisphaera italica]
MSKAFHPNANNTAEASVYNRYAAAAQAREELLCCPVEYAGDFLAVIPQEILERDYGCGDPTRHVHEGETVVDLGSGGGKLCYILSQVVGKRGRVIGVDCNLEMLALARKHQGQVAERLGYDNVDFRYGMIQDLQLDLDLLGRELGQHPIADPSSWLKLRNIEERLRHDQPMIASNTVDCVVSNCVLNLVRQQDRKQLFAEIFRVLKKGGRAAISDIVSDEDVPQELQENPELWSGCISGAFREEQFLQAFEEVGFHGIELVKRQSEPWRTVDGIEFRSVTVVANKGKQGPCLERNQAVIYRGPFKKVEDDDGHAYNRGMRMAVCDKTFHLLQQSPYAGLFEAVEPLTPIPLNDAVPFDCRRSKIRSTRESKGEDYDVTTESIGPCCEPDGECC